MSGTHLSNAAPTTGGDRSSRKREWSGFGSILTRKRDGEKDDLQKTKKRKGKKKSDTIEVTLRSCSTREKGRTIEEKGGKKRSDVGAARVSHQ